MDIEEIDSTNYALLQALCEDMVVNNANYALLKALCENIVVDIRMHEEIDHPDFVTMSRDMKDALEDMLWHINNSELKEV